MFFCHFLILILQESITAHKLVALWLPSIIIRIFVLLDEYSTHAVHFLADSALFIDLHVANVVSDVQALSRILEASASGPSARAQVLSSWLGDVWPHGEHQGDLLEPDQYPSKAYANIFSVKTYIFCKIIVCISIFCAKIRRVIVVWYRDTLKMTGLLFLGEGMRTRPDREPRVAAACAARQWRHGAQDGEQGGREALRQDRAELRQEVEPVGGLAWREERPRETGTWIAGP